jgi:hypothetical protein
MKSIKIILTFLILFAFSKAISQEKVNVKSQAEIKGTGQEANFKAREKALNNAYQMAIEKVILKIIPEQTFKDNQKKIDDAILSNAKSFVKDEEIIDEDASDGKYTISADIVIDKKKLSDAVSSLSLGSAAGNLTEMNLAIAIDEIVYNQNKQQTEVRSGPKSLIGSQIAALMVKNKIKLKSDDIVERIRTDLVGPGGNLSQLILGDKSDDVKSQLASKMISGQYKIDAIVFGTTKINYTGKDKNGFEVATASANIRVIETSTGNVLASALSNETGIAKSENEAGAAASRRLGTVLGQKIVDQLMQKWLDMLNNGIEYEIRFKGLNEDNQKNNLLNLLKELNGVAKASETKWSPADSSLFIKVFYKGKPSDLKESLFNKAFSTPDFSGIREEMVIGNILNYAFGSSIKQRDIAKETPKIPSFEKPTIRAVVIGISKYKDESMNLGAATADAQLVKEYLVSKDGLNIPDDKIKFISDNDATRANVLKAIKDIFSKSGENDLLILYFAGHGWAEDKEMYFLTHDADKENIPTTALTQKDVQKALGEAPAKRQIFIADACHSGAMSLAYMTYVSNASDAFPVSRNVDPRSNVIKRIIGSSTGLAVMTAASANQLSQEGPEWGGGHGIFTWTLMQGLKGEADLNKDRVITMNEAFIYTILKMSQETQGKQTPTATGPLDLPLGVTK